MLRWLRTLLRPPALTLQPSNGRWRWLRRGASHPLVWLEVLLRQLSWWGVRPLLVRQRPSREFRLPRRQALLLCWLNGFRPHEVRQWQAVGVVNTADILQHIPDLQSGLVHQQRRQSWPQQGRPVAALLADKAALLEQLNYAWNPGCLTLLAQMDKGAVSPPDWWAAALAGDGIVLKPRIGNACRGVLHYRQQDGQLQVLPLFGCLPPAAAQCPQPESTPAELAHHWQQLMGRAEPLVAMPYLRHHPALPPSEPATVLRVITSQSHPGGPVAVLLAWLEIPLPPESVDEGAQPPQGPVVFLSLQGQTLFHRDLTTVQQQLLQDWQRALTHHQPILQAVLEAAIQTHQQLPPIDTVAWDWIPTVQGPKLLEGNSGFGLLVPQLFAHLDPAVQARCAVLWEPQPR